MSTSERAEHCMWEELAFEVESSALRMLSSECKLIPHDSSVVTGKSTLCSGRNEYGRRDGEKAREYPRHSLKT